MAKYPAPYWAAKWVQHGGRPDKAREAAAVVMCESNGDTKAVSPVGARGAWQFMPGTLPSDRCALDPDCSTREAVKLSNKGADFSAWDCHPDSVARSGRSTGDETYERIFADLKMGPFSVPAPGPDINPMFPAQPLYEGILKGWAGDKLKDGAEGALGAVGLQPIAAFFVGLGELILTPEGWLRLSKMIGGGILLFWGLRIVVSESTGTDPVHTVKKAGEVAATAVVAKKVPI